LTVTSLLVLLLAAGCATRDTTQDPAAKGAGEGLRVVEPGPAFDDLVMNAERPVLVQCSSPYCGKCRQLSPVLVSLSAEYADRVDFVKVNVPGQDAFNAEHDVRVLPLLLFFANGKEADRLVGAVKEPQIRKSLDAVLEK
jgi:thioredoxin 1